jgi:hypothetical protein
MNHNSSVSIVTRVRPEIPRDHGWISGKDIKFFSFLQSLDHLLSNRHPGIKQTGRETDHSPPSNAVVKNILHPHFLIHLHGLIFNYATWWFHDLRRQLYRYGRISQSLHHVVLLHPYRWQQKPQCVNIIIFAWISTIIDLSHFTFLYFQRHIYSI